MLSFLPKEIKLWINTPHGRGLALCMESFAMDNTIFTVINEEDGKIRCYDSTDLNACPDFTDGINIKNIKPETKP